MVDAVEATVAAYPGMRGQVGTYLSTKLREALTGNPDSITVRVYGNSLDIIRAKAEEIRASMAKIPGIEDPRVELQVEEPSIEVKVDVDRAASFGLKPGDVCDGRRHHRRCTVRGPEGFRRGCLGTPRVARQHR